MLRKKKSKRGKKITDVSAVVQIIQNNQIILNFNADKPFPLSSSGKTCCILMENEVESVLICRVVILRLPEGLHQSLLSSLK